MHALLLTDIVDSTRLAEQLGDSAMAALWAQHDRLARDLLPAWRGREIDRADGMLLLFDTVADAVGYALAYHAALAAAGLPLQARAGVHAGSVTLVSNSAEDVARGAKPLQVLGFALPVVARVMSVALGGQTLLSAEARAALGPRPALALRSHGHWRLKGVSEPLELHEVAAASQAFRVPADVDKAYRVVRQGELWRPLRELRHTLPAERDSFVGRQAALADLAARFDGGARLVSVLGMGGTGKTRLVTRFAWTALGDYPGGIWFCDLAQARSLDGICAAVAQGLELQLGGDGAVGQLAQAIAGRGRCLLVLDNFEQVARHAEATLGQWLDRAPQAQFAVTTREVLGIVGEQVLALAPLAVAEGCELFLRRAAAVRGSPPAADELPAVEQLVGVLDGLPLAIELAAARVRVMAPHVLLARMHDRFDILLSRAGRQDRQATLRAAFDWSWELLAEPEKAALAHLSVFQGGFDFDSATAVLGRPAVDLVLGLVDKSFVRQSADERFELLESVRDYAAQHLRNEGRFDGSGPGCEAEARRRHWTYFAGIDEQAAIAHRCAELNNLVAACRAATAAGEAAVAASCLAGCWFALKMVGPYRAAESLARSVQGLQGLAEADRALVHWVAGSALDKLGEVDAARREFDLGLALAEHSGATLARTRLLLALGSQQTLDGEFQQAQAHLEEALALANRLGHRVQQAWSLNALGHLMDHQARVGEARGYYERALTLARELGDKRLEGGLLGNLGGLHHDLGELDVALQHYQSAMALAHEAGDRQWEGNARSNLGLLHQEQGRYAEARTQFAIALEMARAVGHVRLEYTVLCNQGLLLMAEGQAAAAIAPLEGAVAAARAAGDQRSEGQFSSCLALALARVGRLDQAREALELGEQLILAMGDRLSHALLLCDRAEVESIAERHADALQARQAAERLADAMNCGPRSELRRRLAVTSPATPAGLAAG